MGVRKVKAAVADAGPLIHLTEIDCFWLLNIFKALHIPDAVWSETVGQNRVPQAKVLELNNVHRHSLPQAEVTRFIQENGLEDLQIGECECLYLCQQTGVPVLLTDDLAVRKAAKRLKFIPVGSLGVVVKAHQLGRISLADAKQYITALYDVSSLFVARAIVELAIEQLYTRSEESQRI